MAIEQVREYLRSQNMEDRIQEFTVSSATVALAAEALGCEPDMIAKSLTFKGQEGECIMVVASGMARIDNHKFKETFGRKASMLSPEEAIELTGHAVGGVCPFCCKPATKVYLDNSLKKHEIIYPAASSSNSAVRLNNAELESLSKAIGWVDVCKEPETV